MWPWGSSRSWRWRMNLLLEYRLQPARWRLTVFPLPLGEGKGEGGAFLVAGLLTITIPASYAKKGNNHGPSVRRVLKVTGRICAPPRVTAASGGRLRRGRVEPSRSRDCLGGWKA